jgi:hypothetical protein
MRSPGAPADGRAAKIFWNLISIYHFERSEVNAASFRNKNFEITFHKY